MRFVVDHTGRFRERPYYTPSELDSECERIITGFITEGYGNLTWPIPTDALTKLIERDAADLDLYADLSSEGADVEGVTDFSPGERPSVRIRSELSTDPRREKRLRTTLTHEYGHIYFHGPLFDLKTKARSLFEETSHQPLQCKRESMIKAPSVDWMEWQAGYACGALLMPVSYIRQIAHDFYQKRRQDSPVAPGTAGGERLVKQVSDHFGTSSEAAQLRLLKLGLLSDRHDKNRLF